MTRLFSWKMWRRRVQVLVRWLERSRNAANEGEEGGERGLRIGFLKRPLLPALERLVLENGSRRGTDPAIRMIQVGPGFFDRIGMVADMIRLEHTSRCLQLIKVALLDRRHRRFLADVRHTIQSALNAAAADREVHGAVDR